MRILFIGDVVGKTGRTAISEHLPGMIRDWKLDLVIVNGENAAGWVGINAKIARDMLGMGVDVITLGNHAYHRREIYDYLGRRKEILRPYNYLRSQPGHGTCVVEHDGVRLGVVNLSGNLYMQSGAPALVAIGPSTA